MHKGQVAMAAILMILLSAGSVEGEAQKCLTQSEARSKWPKSHLYWHTSQRCWDNRTGSNRNFLPRPKKRDPIVNSFAAKIKEPDEQDTCCWPSLKELELTFEERWRDILSVFRRLYR